MLLRRALLVVSGAALTGLLILVVGTSPGSAAFPGGSGRIAYTCDPDSQEICLINADGSGLGYLTQYDPSRQNFDERYPVWSPDGRRVAFVVVGYCTNALYVMNSDRTGLRQVLLERPQSSGLLEIGEPSWSPDGTELVFTKELARGRCPQFFPPESSELFTINVSGSGQRQISSSAPASWDLQPAWSPDGASIAFYHWRHAFDEAGLWVMKPDGSSRRRLSSVGGGSPDWSPESSRIAYECHGGGDVCIYSESGVIDLGFGSTPAWSPDGTQIVFRLYGPTQGIYVMAANGTGRHKIAEVTSGGDETAHPDWQPCRGACPPAPGLPTYLKRPKPPPMLFATVGPGFTIAVRNKARRKVKTLVEGSYSIRLRDRSRHHSLHISGRGGKVDLRTSVSAIVSSRQQLELAPGTYRFFCDAHRGLMHGSFRVIADPHPYRP